MRSKERQYNVQMTKGQKDNDYQNIKLRTKHIAARNPQQFEGELNGKQFVLY